MAKIIRDALVLSESESQILKANLLHPTVNQARDEYLRSIENLVVSVSDSSFSVSIPDLVLPEFDANANDGIDILENKVSETPGN